jgi:hypothetical protein
MTRTAERMRGRRRWWPWPMLWILTAAGHALGNAPHPHPAPIPQPVPEDDSFDRATARAITP